MLYFIKYQTKSLDIIQEQFSTFHDYYNRLVYLRNQGNQHFKIWSTVNDKLQRYN